MLGPMGGASDPLSKGRRTPAAFGRLPGIWFGLIVVFATLSWSSDAFAYAWMIRHGYTACGTCHADPSGGELLAPYGRVTGDLILRMHYEPSTDTAAASSGSEGGESFDGFGDFDEDFEVSETEEKPAEAEEAPAESAEPADATPGAGVLWGLWDPPEWLLVSGAFRNLQILRPGSEGDKYTFVPVMQADLYGQLKFGSVRAAGSIGVSKVREGSPHARAAQITTEQGDELNLISRTHWIGVDVGTEYLVRAGRVNLPFGVRIPEHTMWVREATRTDRESDQQAGIAVSYVGNSMRAEIMAILGNYQINPDEFRERGYSLYIEGFAGTNLAAGLSSKATFAKVDPVTEEEDVLRQAHGVMSRWSPWEPLAVLFEFDMLFRTNADAGYVGFLQADYELVQGLHFLATGEVLDEGLSIAEDAPDQGPGQGEPKYGAWGTLDWFFYRQFEFRTDFIWRQEEPFTILGQLHFYL